MKPLCKIIRVIIWIVIVALFIFCVICGNCFGSDPNQQLFWSDIKSILALPQEERIDRYFTLFPEHIPRPCMADPNCVLHDLDDYIRNNYGRPMVINIVAEPNKVHTAVIHTFGHSEIIQSPIKRVVRMVNLKEFKLLSENWMKGGKR